MAISDIKGAMEDQGIPRGTAIAALSLLGAGVQTYDSSAPTGTIPKERDYNFNDTDGHSHPLTQEAKTRFDAFAESEEHRTQRILDNIKLKNAPDAAKKADQEAENLKTKLTKQRNKIGRESMTVTKTTATYAVPPVSRGSFWDALNFQKNRTAPPAPPPTTVLKLQKNLSQARTQARATVTKDANPAVPVRDSFSASLARFKNIK